MPVVRAYFENLFGSPSRQASTRWSVCERGGIQAGVLSGEVGNIVLIDVTPLTLLFTTAADMQTAVTVHVFQGERPTAADNASASSASWRSRPRNREPGAEERFKEIAEAYAVLSDPKRRAGDEFRPGTKGSFPIVGS